MKVIGIVVALAVVVGAVHHFRGSTRSPHSAAPRQFDVGEQNGGVAYGDTQDAVARKLGSPDKKQTACWTYNAVDHTINGEYLGKVIDGVKYCFADGPVGGKVVSSIYEHLIPSANASLPKDKRSDDGWIHAFTIASSGSQKLKF